MFRRTAMLAAVILVLMLAPQAFGETSPCLWEGDVVHASGTGRAPREAWGTPQARGLAVRAATVVALTNLTACIRRHPVWGPRSEGLPDEVFFQGAQVDEITYLPDGSVRVRATADLSAPAP